MERAKIYDFGVYKNTKKTLKFIEPFIIEGVEHNLGINDIIYLNVVDSEDTNVLSKQSEPGDNFISFLPEDTAALDVSGSNQQKYKYDAVVMLNNDPTEVYEILDPESKFIVRESYYEPAVEAGA